MISAGELRTELEKLRSGLEQLTQRRGELDAAILRQHGAILCLEQIIEQCARKQQEDENAALH